MQLNHRGHREVPEIKGFFFINEKLSVLSVVLKYIFCLS